jgi:hypothetical protein
MEKTSVEKLRFELHHSKFYLLTPVFFVLVSCSSVAQKTGGNSKPYYEDLAKLRPKVEMPVVEVKSHDSVQEVKPPISPTKNVNAKVDIVLDSIDRFNLTRKFIDGFTIQIYSGQKKDDAMNVIKKMKEEVPGLNANPIRYEQPKFRVTVGKYFTRLEAQSDLLALKRKFSTASLVPEKIPLH